MTRRIGSPSASNSCFAWTRATAASSFESVVPFAASSPDQRAAPSWATSGRPPTRSSTPSTVARQGRPGTTRAVTGRRSRRAPRSPARGGGRRCALGAAAATSDEEERREVRRQHERRFISGAPLPGNSDRARTPCADRTRDRRDPASVVLPPAWMRQSRLALACAALACGACGGRGDANGAAGAPTTRAVATGRRGGRRRRSVPLGLPDLAAFQWRERGGHPAFRIARKAEAERALGRRSSRRAGRRSPPIRATSRPRGCSPPGSASSASSTRSSRRCTLAVAGDFGKWGPASLELPALAGVPRDARRARRGARRVEQDRAAYVAALARSVIVTAGGDLYAYDPKGPRWYRLTRTWRRGDRRAARARRRSASSTSRAAREGQARGSRSPSGSSISARGRTYGAVELGTKGPIAVAYSTKQSPGVWIGTRGRARR